MFQAVHPKLPMRDKATTKNFYVELLGFEIFGGDYDGYLMVERDAVQLHFFEFAALNPFENYGQVYIRVTNIENWYKQALEMKLPMPKAGKLETKPWQMKEFSLLDPDHNLLTFGEEI